MYHSKMGAESPLGMVNKPIDNGVLVASYFAMLQRRIFVVIKRIDHRLDSIIFTVISFCDVCFAFTVNIQYSCYCDIVKKEYSNRNEIFYYYSCI